MCGGGNDGDDGKDEASEVYQEEKEGGDYLMGLQVFRAQDDTS